MASAVHTRAIDDTHQQGKSQYRAEIDGLRALAVIAVIINHFNGALLPSGYLGVDIFFVISGYVITSSLTSRPSRDFGDFIRGFYLRRIKRLVPALVLFTLGTSMLICLFNPDPGKALTTGCASLFGVSNLYLLSQSTDYFAESTELNPFTHTWSLGVEEQFYFLFPVLIWFTGFGKQSPRGAKNLFFWVGALSLASLISFISLYQSNQPAAYFLMPTRFWELAAGCLIFVGFQKRTTIEQRLERLPPLLVTAAMIGVMFWPVATAVPATIAMVVLSAVLIASLKPGTAAYQLFTHKCFVAVGLISYSLYLWHWPVLSISRWTIGIQWWSAPFQIIAMLALALLSYRLIETPIRQTAPAASATRLPFALLISLLVSGLAVKAISKHANRLYQGDAEPIRAESDMTIAGRDCIYSDRFPACSSDARTHREESRQNQQQIIIVGDSHAQRHAPLASELEEKLGIKVSINSVPAYPFPPNKLIRLKDPQGAKLGFEKQMSSMKQALESLRRGDILTIINSGSYSSGRDSSESRSRSSSFRFPDSNWEGDNQDLFLSRLSASLDQISNTLQERGVSVIYFLPNPKFTKTEITDCFPQWFQVLNPKPLCHEQQPQRAVSRLHENTLTPALARLGKRDNLLIYSPLRSLCQNSVCKRMIDGKQLYTDGSHLTVHASKLVSNDFARFLISSGLVPGSKRVEEATTTTPQ